jgi:hypothetical protein
MTSGPPPSRTPVDRDAGLTREQMYLDPYRSLPPAPIPASGSADRGAVEMSAAEEPPVYGTLFLTIVLLMIIGAVWIVSYLFMLAR